MILCRMLWPSGAAAQTPSPLAEWQYSAGQPLQPYFLDEVPLWQYQLGGGINVAPRYEGSSVSRLLPSANAELRFKDLAFASLAEGLGVNLWSGKGHRAGVALTYDVGRRERADGNLRGLGNVDPAPELKLFVEYLPVFPLVLRADARRAFGGHGGATADFSAYMPVVGSRIFVLMLGPSVTWSDRRALQRSFGVSPAQSAQSAYPVFAAHGGLHSISLGLSATRFMSENREWFLNISGAAQKLLGAVADSPITRDDRQYALSLMFGRQW